jgi:hypothetical protein
MYYKGYSIERDRTGFAPIDSTYSFRLLEDDLVIGWGETIEDCKKQIDELLN